MSALTETHAKLDTCTKETQTLVESVHGDREKLKTCMQLYQACLERQRQQAALLATATAGEAACQKKRVMQQQQAKRAEFSFGTWFLAGVLGYAAGTIASELSKK